MRAKFKVMSVKDGEWNGKKNQSVNLMAVHGGDSNAEDNQFSEATPSGDLRMTITNPAALDFLKEGESYYLDFTHAPDSSSN